MNSKIATVSPNSKSVDAGIHSAVLETRAAAAGADILPAGELAAFDADGKVIQYDPEGVAPANAVVGVIMDSVDTAGETPDTVLMVHGTPRRDALTVKGVAADDDAIAALKAIGIFAA